MSFTVRAIDSVGNYHSWMYKAYNSIGLDSPYYGEDPFVAFEKTFNVKLALSESHGRVTSVTFNNESDAAMFMLRFF